MGFIQLFVAANLLTGLVFLVLALITWRQSAGRSFLRRWTIFCLLGAGFGFSAATSNLTSQPGTGELLVRLSLSFGASGSLALLLFSLAYAAPALRRRRVIEALGLAWCGLLIVLFWASDLLLAGVEPDGVLALSPRPGPLMPLYALSTFLHLGGVLWLIVGLFRRSSGLRRIQTAYILVGGGLGSLVSGAGSLIPSLTGQHTVLTALPHFAVLFIPLSVTYAIVRHRLWDISTILHKTALWLLLSLTMLVPLYAFLVWAAPLIFTLPLMDQALLLLGLFSIGYLYLQLVKPPLDHLFQRRKYSQHRELERFAREMATLGRLEEVASSLDSVLARTLYPQTCVVIHSQPGSGGWRKKGQSQVPSLNPEQLMLHPFLEQLIALGGAVDRSQVEQDLRLRAQLGLAEAFFSAAEAQVCLPLVQKGRALGLVLLGPKKNLKPYSRSDLEFFEQLGTSATVALANSLLYARVDLQREELEELAASLEQRVEVRTAELEQVNRRLERAFEEVKQLDALRSRFFANISHELRTPLALILSPLESLLAGEQGALSPRQQPYLETVRRNALQLLKLISDLLDLSRLEESTLQLNLAKLDLGQLAAQVLESARPLAERRGVKLLFEREDAALLVGDAEKITRVLTNLLSNALKFTRPGGQVTLRLRRLEGHLALELEDSGIGIPAAELPRIFDRFHQVESAALRNIGGTGIGLALAKELVELHQGSISVRSTPGVGTVFTVELPLELQQAQPAAGAQPEPSAAEESEEATDWVRQVLTRPEYGLLELESGFELRDPPDEEASSARRLERRLTGADRVPVSGAAAEGKLILVVEDNPSMCQFVAAMLARRYRVITAENGRDGLELARDQLPALVLCDVMMPLVDGLELCRQLKSDPVTAGIPVIMLTARKSLEDSVQAFQLGADDYVTKPFSHHELLARVEAQLRIRELDQAIARGERMQALGSTAAGLAHEILNPLNAIINGLEALKQVEEEAVRRELLDVVKGSAQRILGTVDALRSFVRLDEAAVKAFNLNEGIRSTLQLLAHRLEGRQVHLALELEQKVVCAGALVNQVLSNLVSNAADAAGPGGQLWISSAREGDQARISVRDSGPGIRAADRERIFRPFFTTKPVGSGTGMGLAIAKQIVERHGGTLAVTSAAGQGAELTVSLPLIPLGRGGRPEAGSRRTGEQPTQEHY